MHTNDPIVNNVVNKMIDRSNEGMIKYGVTMEREDVPTYEWLNHAIEELLDAAIYMERCRQDFMALKPLMAAVLEEVEEERDNGYYRIGD